MLAERSRRMSAIVAGAVNSPHSASNTPGKPKLSERELKSLFDECLKVAAENKINANNSWSLGLIEYFHDMTYLKEGDSINFQKASCTLDGCVKIYTSRVDFVDSETKKLMSGLADTSDPSARHENEDDELGDMDDEGGHGSSQRSKKKKAPTPGNTLEQNMEKLNSQKFDLEFVVDPLFKKTCADFDEGGARGLLLNHLSLGLDGKIVFDATEEQQTVVDTTYDTSIMVDVSVLRDKFKAQLMSLEEQFICPSLKDFQFNENNNFFDPAKYLEQAQEFLQAATIAAPVMSDDDDVGEAMMDCDQPGDFGWDGGFDMPADDAPIESLSNPIPKILEQMDSHRRKSMRVSLAMGELGADNQVVEWAPDEESHDTMFSYFDKALVKNWMGPEMWRARSVKEKAAAKPDDGEPAKKKRTRNTTEIDFSMQVNDSTLFAKSSATIDMPKTLQASRNLHLLPDDMQFSSKDFLTLFLKPGQMIKFRRRIQQQSPRENDEEERRDEEEVVEVNGAPAVPRQEMEFWAQNEMRPEDNVAVDVGFGADDGPGGFDDGFDDGMDHSIHLQDDEPAGGVMSSLFPQSEGQFLASTWESQLVSEPKKVKTQFLNYARVAKKVDVKRLKENIWSTYQQDLVDHQQHPRSSLGNAPSEQEPSECVQFTKIVHDLKPKYPEGKWNDISVAFCFICLLHLANENDLEIMPVAQEDAGVCQDLLVKGNLGREDASGVH